MKDPATFTDVTAETAMEVVTNVSVMKNAIESKAFYGHNVECLWNL